MKRDPNVGWHETLDKIAAEYENKTNKDDDDREDDEDSYNNSRYSRSGGGGRYGGGGYGERRPFVARDRKGPSNDIVSVHIPHQRVRERWSVGKSVGGLSRIREHAGVLLRYGLAQRVVIRRGERGEVSGSCSIVHFYGEKSARETKCHHIQLVNHELRKAAQNWRHGINFCPNGEEWCVRE